MVEDLENVEVLYHSSIKISKNKIIYIDPFKIKENYNDADIIFITHSHYDHFSEKDIIKVKKQGTKIVITKDLEQKTLNLGFEREDIIEVEPNEQKSIDGISFETIPAYNVNKKFHPKENNWVGYIIEINGEVINKDVPKEYYLLNKPRNYICSLSDEKQRKRSPCDSLCCHHPLPITSSGSKSPT